MNAQSDLTKIILQLSPNTDLNQATVICTGIHAFVLFDLMLYMYVHGKQLRSCWDGQLLNHTVPRHASRMQLTSFKCTFFR